MANQIIEVPDISIVKTVDGTKQLFSLRDQKVKKDGALLDFGTGSGIKAGNDLYVLKSDDKGYYIPFAGSFEDSLGNLPIQKSGVILLPSGFVDFSDNGYITYDIGDLLKDKDKITIELDYMFFTYTQQNVIVPVFTTDKTIFPYDLPMTIWCEYCTWNNMDYNVVYSCGVPEDRKGTEGYNRMVINKWYHSKITWVYSKRIFLAG